MTKYRLVEDIDLVRHVATERGVRYFHLPLGSPIGGGGTAVSATSKVTSKTPAYMVNGKGYDEFGVAVKAAEKMFDTPVALKSPSVSTAAVAPTLRPRGPERASGAPSAEEAIAAAQKRNAGMAAEDALAARIAKSADLSSADMASAKAFWDAHKPSPAESESLATDLGLNPAHADKSIKELRKAIKSRKTKDEDRQSMKAELAKRVAIAKATTDELPGFTNRLTKAFEDKPEDADLAPTVGETLAAHPNLGALAHIWDRLRVTGYNVRKGLKKGEATDEIPRILARSLASVLTVGLMLHFGVMIPGLGSGG